MDIGLRIFWLLRELKKNKSFFLFNSLFNSDCCVLYAIRLEMEYFCVYLKKRCLCITTKETQHAEKNLIYVHLCFISSH